MTNEKDIAESLNEYFTEIGPSLSNNVDETNYRPISVLSVVSKLFEKLIYQQMYSYLDNNELLIPFQSGFRKGNSTSTSLLNTTNTWLVNMDRGLINGVIFLDLKKACDTVDHAILIKKLELYGIKGNCLRDRTQVCKVGKTISSKKYMKTGVPQGSNLGSLLFILYVNDLPNCLSNSIPALFADDTNVTTSGSSMEDIQLKLNNELDNLHHWLPANKLSLNVSKTEYMIIGSQQRLTQISTDPKISIGSQNISRVKETKTLAVLGEENISWKNHIEATCKNILKTTGMMTRVKSIICNESPKTVIQSVGVTNTLIIVLWFGIIARIIQKIDYKNFKIKLVE